MTARDYRVMVIYRGRIHESLAKATSPAAALKVALKEQRTLREAVRDGKAGWEVTTV
jgi:hypothetical protein